MRLLEPSRHPPGTELEDNGQPAPGFGITTDIPNTAGVTLLAGCLLRTFVKIPVRTPSLHFPSQPAGFPRTSISYHLPHCPLGARLS